MFEQGQGSKEAESNGVMSENLTSEKLNDIQKNIFEVIISNLSDKVCDNVSMDMDFSSLAIDSITFIKMIVALEGVFDFEFDDEMLMISKFPTVKSMVEYVDSKVSIT